MKDRLNNSDLNYYKNTTALLDEENAKLAQKKLKNDSWVVAWIIRRDVVNNFQSSTAMNPTLHIVGIYLLKATNEQLTRVRL